MATRFSVIGLGMLLVLAWPAPTASGASSLSPAQVSVVSRQIARLKYPEERGLAAGWTDAKKVAEFICRPLALKALKRRFRDADRVFLGSDDPATLRLTSARRLEGNGQVRTGSRWQTFTFACVLDPLTGNAVSFNANTPQ